MWNDNFLLIGQALGWILVIAIGFSPSPRNGRWLFLGIILPILFHQFVSYRRWVVHGGVTAVLHRFGPVMTLLLATCLLLYTRVSLWGRCNRSDRRLLAVPALALGAYLIWLALAIPTGKWQDIGPALPEAVVRTLLMTTYFLWCWFACLRTLKFYEETQFKNQFSSSLAVDLTWIRILLASLFGLILAGNVDFYSNRYLPLFGIFVSFATLVIALLVWQALRLSSAFSVQENAPPGEELGREIKSHLEAAALEKKQQQLADILKRDRPYLNPDLKLSDLATAMDLRPYLVTEVIGRGFQTTFYELINRLRVEEVKRRLLDSQYQHLSILGIATDCGFNSKSAFNEMFKRYAGVTPSEFRRQNGESHPT